MNIYWPQQHHKSSQSRQVTELFWDNSHNSCSIYCTVRRLLSSQSPVRYPQVLMKQNSNTEFYESTFPAVYFEHFLLLTSHLSSATCLLECHLNFSAYHSLKRLSRSEETEWYTSAATVITGEQIIKYDMKFNMCSVRNDAVHCGIKVRSGVELVEFKDDTWVKMVVLNEACWFVIARDNLFFFFTTVNRFFFK